MQGSELVWFDRKGTRLDKVAEQVPAWRRQDLAETARARRTANAPRGPTFTSDIWILDTTTGRTSRATFGAGLETSAALSADGKQLAFNSDRHDVLDIFMKPSDGSGDETELWHSNLSKAPIDWTADGRHLLIDGDTACAVEGRLASRLAPPAGPRLWALPLEGERRAFPASPGTSNETPGGFSPDAAGRWLTYSSSESQRGEVFVVPFPPTGSKWQISKDGGVQPRWSSDGKEIYFIQPGLPSPMMMAASVDASGSAVKVIDIKPLFPVTPTGPRGPYSVMPDGQRFLINTLASRAPATLPPPTVVINWPKLRGK